VEDPVQIKDVLSIIVSGVLLQVLIQVYFIQHCWENTRLTTRRKFIYILSIIVFNLPAAVY